MIHLKPVPRRRVYRERARKARYSLLLDPSEREERRSRDDYFPEKFGRGEAAHGAWSFSASHGKKKKSLGFAALAWAEEGKGKKGEDWFCPNRPSYEKAPKKAAREMQTATSSNSHQRRKQKLGEKNHASTGKKGGHNEKQSELAVKNDAKEKGGKKVREKKK